jgi:DNA-directed RNA polymerase subunit H (RpoH/RPB5)
MASQNISTLTSQIYKSRVILLELLKTQGYNTTDYEGFSINEVNTMKINNQLDMILEKKSSEIKEQPEEKESTTESSVKIYVKYYLTKSLRPNNLQEIIDDLFMVEEVLTKRDNLLVVVKDEVNETMMSAVKHIWETEKVFVILYPLKRLLFNILNHTLVPFHRVLSEAEKISIKTKYNITDDNEFPEINRFTDPVALAIGIRPGEVCEITRPSKTAISAPYYRICV